MNCPYCEINLEEKINYNHKDDHLMDCPACEKTMEVTYDTYPDECTDEVIDIFELNKKGDFK